MHTIAIEWMVGKQPLVSMVLRWFLVWQTIGTNGFAMVFGLATIGSNGFRWFCSPATIGPNGFSMVSNGS